MHDRRFTAYAWGVVVFTLGVILWGDVVQVTGSGNGCGSSWPLCTGAALVPENTPLATFIESFHRVTSTLTGVLAIGLVAWAFRAYPKGSLVRPWAVASLVFVLIEGLLGAALVRFELVAGDTSVARAVIAPVHLVNTLLLTGCMALTAWFSSHPARPVFRGQGALPWVTGAGLGGILLVAASGSVTSLGDVLFPVQSTAEALQRAAEPGRNFLDHLRVYHPFIAVLVSLLCIGAAFWVAAARPAPATRDFARLCALLFGVQLLVGYLNVQAKAALFTQLPHLLMSDMVWMGWLLLSVTALAQGRRPAPRPVPAGEAG